jgi:SnoaL-like domain
MTARDEIREVVANWVLWRDGGDWDRFATVWHPLGYMSATWVQGSATDFIERSREGRAHGVQILHQISGTAVDVAGDRAIAVTRMSILQRGVLSSVEVDVVCVGKFYDFFQVYEDQWKLRRRQPIYEKDRLDPVDPSALLRLDADLLERFPSGYRHLGYLQTMAGFDVKGGLPGWTGPEVDQLQAEGAAWLAGSAEPGKPA